MTNKKHGRANKLDRNGKKIKSLSNLKKSQNKISK